MGDLFPLFGPGSSDRSYRRNRHNQNVSLSETHIFSSNIFNEARAGWNRSFTFEELETSFKSDISDATWALPTNCPSRATRWNGDRRISASRQSSSALGLPGLRTGAPWNPNGGQIWHFADNLSIVQRQALVQDGRHDHAPQQRLHRDAHGARIVQFRKRAGRRVHGRWIGGLHAGLYVVGLGRDCAAARTAQPVLVRRLLPG